MNSTWKERAGRLFGLPADQIKTFDELTPEQVDEVRLHFTAELVGVQFYAFAVRRDGHLVVHRERIRPEWFW